MKLFNRLTQALTLCFVVTLCLPPRADAAAGAWTISNAFKSRILNGAAPNLTSDTIKVVLVSSSSNVVSGPADCYTGGTGTALTGELSTANGYTSGGATASSPGISGTSTVTFDTADVTWTASGGSLVARWSVMVDTTVAAKTIIAYAVLDSTPADVTVTTGNTLTIGISNVFSLARLESGFIDYAVSQLIDLDAMAANDPIYLIRRAL